MYRKFLNHEDTLKKTPNQKFIKDAIAYSVIGLAAALTVGTLLLIIGFIFVNGASHMSPRFFVSGFDDDMQYLEVPVAQGSENNLGIRLKEATIKRNTYYVVDAIESNANVHLSLNRTQTSYPIKKGDAITHVAGTRIDSLSLGEINTLLNQQTTPTITVRLLRPGGGVYPMIITTLMMIGLALLIACPIGIFAAIYLVEYAREGRIVNLIRFATQSLAGIPSIIYGLFGMIMFVTIFNLGFSILSGALTVSIILLPVIIRQTEESLKAVPMTYREGSLGLGATKLQTIRKAVMPSAIPGILVAVILSIGRVIGESAALLLTAGTAARIPTLMQSGATLTIKAYTVAKEEGDIQMACAIGTVILLIIFILNGLSKLITSRYMVKTK